MIPDVNVLVAASRGDHPHHRIARSWLVMQPHAAGASLKLTAYGRGQFLRLVTSEIFVTPTPVKEAVIFVDALLSVPGVDIPVAGAEWPLLRHLCLEKQVKSNSVPDAWLAATVMQLGEHLVTFDTDFKKLLRRERLTVLAV